MSKEVDQRVVEMRFDNKQFEENVKTSMSTLDRLKKALNLDGASKGLENVGNAAKNVDMSPLSGAVETVRVKFSALEVMGVTALANITNSAVNAGKQLVKSLSIDQIISGYQKYEQETSNVQTLMNSTGKSVDEINGYLDKLMWFSDETSYGFTDMTSALSSMVSSGGDIEKLIPMIEGMATATAYAGKGATEFSRVIYNLNQSYGQGYLSLMDWKSVEQAGASSKQLKEIIIDVAKEVGTLNEAGYTLEKGTEVTFGTFAQTLNEKWVTSEVMEKAFTRFSEYAVAVQEEAARTGKSTSQVMDELSGKYDSISVKAFEAAQKAKTFTEAIDATKDAVSSEWKKIWKTIIGDYEQAASLWTDISGDLWDIFVGPLEGLTESVNGAFSSSWEQVKDQITSAGVPIEDFKTKLIELGKKNGVVTDEMIEQAGSFENSLKSGWLSGNLISEALMSYTDSAKIATQATKNLEKIVNQVIRGDFGNGEDRVKRLTEAGYDYNTVQTMVNKTLWGQEVNYEVLSDAQLENLGFTEEQIKAIRELAEQAEKTGTPLNELIASMEKPSGRELVIDTIRNALNGLKGVVLALQSAFTGITSSGLYSFIEGLNNLSKHLILVDNETGELNEKGQKLSRTFKGFFAIIQLINKIIKGAFKVAFTLASKILGTYNGSVLDVTASVGDSIVAFTEWIDKNERISKITENIITFLTPLANGIRTVASKIIELTLKVKDFIVEIYKLPAVQSTINNCKNACVSFAKEAGKRFVELGGNVKDLLGNFKDFFTDLISGKKKLSDFPEWIKSTFSTKGITESAGEFKQVLGGVSSQITEMQGSTETSLGKMGISFTNLGNTVSSAFNKIKNVLSQNVGFGEIFTVVLGGGIFLAIKKILDIVSLVKKPVASLDTLLTNLSGGVEGLFDSLIKSKNAEALKSRSEAILNFAKAVGILALVLFGLTKIEFDNLNKATHILGVLTLAIIGIYVAMALVSKFAGGGKTGNLPIVSLITSLVSLVAALKSMQDLDMDKAWSSLGLIVVMLLVLKNIVVQLGILNKISPDGAKGTALVIGLAISIKILVSALSDLNGMDINQTITSLAIVELLFQGMINVIAAMAVCSKLGGNIGTSGAGILAIAASLILTILAIKMISKISTEDLIKGLGVVIVIFGVFTGVMAASKLAGKEAATAGTSILAMSAALLLVTIAIKALAKIDGKDLTKATAAVIGIFAVFTGVTYVLTNFCKSGDLKGVAVVLLSMSAALLLVTAVVVILGHIEGKRLAKAIAALSGIMAMFAGLIAISKLAKDCKDTIIALTVAIGVIALAIAAVSFISADKLVAATLAISTVVGMFALLMLVTQYTKSAKECAGTMAMLIGIMLAIGGVFAILSSMDAESILNSAAALSTILLSISSSVLLISKFGEMSVQALISLGAMMLLVNLLSDVFVRMNTLDPDVVLPIALGISTVIAALSAACILLAVAGNFGAAGFIGVGILAVLIVALGALLVGIGALVTYVPQVEEFLDKAMPILSKIGFALGDFAGQIIAGFAGAVLDIIPLIGQKFSEFWFLFQPFLQGVKTIGKDALEGVLNLVAIMLAMGAAELISALGVFIGSGNSLTDFGKELVSFASYAVAFGQTMSKLTPAELTAMILSANAVKAMCGVANAVPKHGGLLQMITGDNNLVSFGKELIKFAPTLIDYANKMLDFKQEHLDAVKRSCEGVAAICNVADKVPKRGGLVALITGENSLVDFSTELISFGPSLIDYSTKMLDFKQEHLDAVKLSCKGVEEICKVAEKVPKHGGLVSLITGDNSLTGFAEELVAFGPSLIDYSTKMLDFKQEHLDAVKLSCKGIVEIVKVAETIPKHGGLVSLITGDNSLTGFADELNAMAPSLVSYAKKVSEDMGEEKYKAIEDSLSAISKIVKVAEKIPHTGGIASWFSGDNSLGGFANELKKVGQPLVDLGKKLVDEMPDGGMKAISSATSELSKLIELASTCSGLDMNGFKSFGTALKELATVGIGKFVDQFNGSGEKAKKAVQSFVNKATDGAKSKKEDFKKAFETIVNEAINAMTASNKNKDSKFKEAGKKAMTEFKSGVNANKSTVTVAVGDIADVCISELRKYQGNTKSRTGFFGVAEYLVYGFANGMRDGAYMASSAAKSLANAAIKAAKKALDERSPSHIFYDIGDFAGLGFVNALYDYGETAYTAGSEIATSAKDGLTDAISKVKDVVDGKISGQPTIRPVLDLSDVESGARRIGGLFGNRQAIELATSGIVGSQNGSSRYVINMTINGAQGQDVEQLADLVSIKLNDSIQRRSNVWR